MQSNIQKNDSANQYDVIVLGAGAAGLMAAITAASKNRSVLVVEKSNKIGKKLTWLISSSITLMALLIFYLYEINTLQELLFLVAFIGFGSGAGGILFWSMLPAVSYTHLTLPTKA